MPSNPDYNGEYQEGASHLQTTTSPGRERWSASAAYLWPHVHKRRNLEIVTNADVARLLIKCEQDAGGVAAPPCAATGVALATGAAEKLIRARKQVVLTASAVFTPKILMLSGEREHGASLKELRFVAAC